MQDKPQPPTQPLEPEKASAPSADQLKDQYLRSLADLENTRKRLSREKEEFVKYAAESMVRGLLPILDSLDQALVAAGKRADAADLLKGLQLIHRQLLALLQKEGVERLQVVGEPFDPHRHEAVAHAEIEDETQDGKVVEEMHVGYTMHGKVLRPAMVKVGKATNAGLDPQTE